MKDEYFDTIHQEGFGKDFESEYSDILHDESFGNKDSKIGQTLAPKEMREKEKKTRCQDTYFEKYITRAIATRTLAPRTTNVDRLFL